MTMTIPTDGRIDLDALAEEAFNAKGRELGGPFWHELPAVERERILRTIQAIDLARRLGWDASRRAAIPSEQGEAVALGSEDDPESLAYALRIGAVGTPFNNYQGTLYMNPRYKADDFRDAEFRDHGLARAVRVILNNAEAIRAALAHPAPAAGVSDISTAPTGEDWRVWCEEWHAAVDSASLMLGLPVGLGASEFVEAVRSYTHPAPAAGVKVKALEWEDPSPKNNNVWVARTVLGTYCVGCEGGWWYAVLDEGFRHWEWEPENDARSYSGPFAAQAAAQQDYEARILSALDQGEPK